MNTESLRGIISWLCVLAVGLGPAATPLLSQETPVTGRIAGRVLNRSTGTPLEGARVDAKLITENVTVSSAATDGLGSYTIPDVPAGIYAIRVSHGGSIYRVADHFDIRMNMSYLLEACFALDSSTLTAHVSEECVTGLYPERQIVSVGASRYFNPETPSGARPTVELQIPLEVSHRGLSCMMPNSFVQLSADVNPPDAAMVTRAYFRAEPNKSFYYVELQKTSSGLRAIMPKPSPETRTLAYYIETVGPAGERAQSSEFTMTVGECTDSSVVYFTESDPCIVVGATVPGETPTPPGFESTGVSAFISSTGTVVPVSGCPGAVAAAAPGAATGAGSGLGARGIILIVGAAAGTIATLALVSTSQTEASPP